MNEQVAQFSFPENTKNIVIFVHGFGVRWDSRGMFTDIQQSLPKGWGSALFDFYSIKENDVYITPITQQIARLTEIIQTTKARAPKATIHIIAHSKGCIITALAQPAITGRIIFLAPPETFGTKLERYFTRYPGATSTATELILPRKDGTITHIPLNFFPQTQSIDAEDAMLAFSRKHSVHLLQTIEDEVIGITEYKNLSASPRVTITPLAADHNFTGRAREKLINYIKEIVHE